ncbi:MAG: 2-oxoglutarate dehydrogenase complex dihydrolipoyllysine-residue succinyltransferase [Planctomycetota bacterium]|nr:MAG: 2-oxoglutarate dehydrogenase complex dihydrolipoyllysine-residue succinyltransferase [Planctomycetota bacterium]
MVTPVTIPSFGESITEVEIESWNKQEGEYVEADETLCTLASDKASLDLPSPVSGLLTRILKPAGEIVAVGETIAEIDEAAARPAATAAASEPTAAQPTGSENEGGAAQPATEPAQKTPAPAAPATVDRAAPAGPAVRRMLAEHGLRPEQVQGTGPRGRITPEDVQRAVAAAAAGGASAPSAAAPSGRQERVVRMSPIRRRIAERLLEATRNTAMLTTFNEVDMQPIMTLRKRYKERFLETHGVKLGFMSFFVKAVIEGLKAFPAINAEIRGDSIVYKDWFDIGVAIGGGKGLVVPVIRDADALSFAEIEKAIADFAERAKAGRIRPEELQGGTFTISNGGVYGSLLSTPILNPPQSGILGMHKIEQRPRVVDGEIVVRPMMYVALTYDHRIVDGREAVQFLVTVKDKLEDPARMLLEV